MYTYIYLYTASNNSNNNVLDSGRHPEHEPLDVQLYGPLGQALLLLVSIVMFINSYHAQ